MVLYFLFYIIIILSGDLYGKLFVSNTFQMNTTNQLVFPGKFISREYS